MLCPKKTKAIRDSVLARLFHMVMARHAWLSASTCATHIREAANEVSDECFSYAPVVLFVYNRPRHTRTTLEALAQNTLAAKTHLHVFSDGPKNEVDRSKVEGVRQIARAVSGFASLQVIERPQNLGLANSIIMGVTEILEAHESVIVLEDDLVTTPQFLTYMNSVLTHYRDDPHVFSVTGHNFPAETLPIPWTYRWDTYAGYRCSSWSWGTWSDRWRLIDWGMSYYDNFIRDEKAKNAFSRGGPDMVQLLTLQQEGKVDSWAIRFCYAHFAHDMRCIYPVKSLVKNIGLDNSGTHCGPNPRFHHGHLDEEWCPRRFCPADSVDPELASLFYNVFCSIEPKLPDGVGIKMRDLSRRLVGKVKQVISELWRT